MQCSAQHLLFVFALLINRMNATKESSKRFQLKQVPITSLRIIIQNCWEEAFDVEIKSRNPVLKRPSDSSLHSRVALWLLRLDDLIKARMIKDKSLICLCNHLCDYCQTAETIYASSKSSSVTKKRMSSSSTAYCTAFGLNEGEG